ncbi:hypothetical protein K7X08_031071 [Anisodus acutangulus]|uniref:Transcription factor CBF/NF-Y/archaeal histone domain-containing protein n=1 Tax=Anisodus acutangulus TaxID=402998 RepID=A0A9Q1MPE7_9SOLA|nr:hypothetical protein K7X08_031071 [Anisodus acutangulus]
MISVGKIKQYTNVLEKPLSKGKQEVSLSGFAFLFSELVQYNQSQVDNITELERRLEDAGYAVGARILELLCHREKGNRRETRLLGILSFVHSTVWKVLFGKIADSLEKGTEHEDEYMISEKELLVNRFISVPKDMGAFNCGAFVAGIVRGVLENAGFPAVVTAHFVPVEGQHRPRTTILIKFAEEVLRREATLDGSMNMSAQLNQAIATTNNNNNNNNNNVSSANVFECTVREQDRFMPITNVIRIMRKILPPHAKISDSAKETIQECVSEFISFVTSEANDRCQREQRKTITAEDVLWAMSKLGFNDYIEPLILHLHRYRELDGSERSSLKGEPLLMKPRGAMIDSATSTSIANMTPINYPLPPNFTMAHHHHHGYFAYAHMSNGYMHCDANVASNSQANCEANNVESFGEHKE